MDSEEAGLAALAQRMNKQQRQEMADIINTELQAREQGKRKEVQLTMKSAVNSSTINSNLDRDAMKDIYTDVQDSVRQAKIKKINDQLAALRSQKQGARTGVSRISELRLPSINLPKVSFRALLLGLLIVLGLTKLYFTASPSVEMVGEKNRLEGLESDSHLAAVNQSDAVHSSVNVAKKITDTQPRTDWSPEEKILLGQLDVRRVELERRSAQLDSREAELNTQSQALAERLIELRGLTERLSAVRSENDRAQEERLEQLANVYGSMQPKEAAPLIGRLDDKIALALLERMPGKRMGQILSSMDSARAIELTKLLSARDKR